ncbi:hypothetical protein CEXT_525261 [Caerostris extrusa]|uniref:Uncharacterized protein n=1 Tax=Caerostris extrusa TaxID=172846 RepID=A0AAV4MNZ7_CAEEX|nr:hypothetical protein CEXT_525261 [Caerostris extrusa]
MFSDESLENIILGLEKNKFLLSLNLKGNNIRSFGTQVLGNFFVTIIIYRNLSWNNIGLIGGRTILKSLSKNKTVLLLEISGNDLSSDILEAIQIATSANAQKIYSK